MDQGIALSHQKMHYYLKVLRTTPMIYMCRNVIHHHLFGNGIEFSHRRGRVRPDPHMQEIMSDYWLPCCREMIDQAITLGFVIIRIVSLEDGLKVPVVLDPAACRVKMLYVLGLREYLVMDDQQNEIPDTHVFDLFGHSPSASGQMTSIVANLMPEIKYINTLRGTSIVMEQKRADPVLMTEAVDTKVDNVEGINYDYYADGDMQDTSSDNRFTRDRHNVAALRNQQVMYDAFFAGGRPASVGGNVLENMVNVPLGQKIVNIPTQTGRGDITAQVKTFQDIVCGVMGIPRALLMSDTPHKSDEEGTHQTFKKTILAWKTSLQSVCEQIYSIIYAEDIKQQLLKAIGNKKRKRTDIADVYVLKKRLQVQIIFPISPFLSHGELYSHYQNGVITWETYSEHACANASLPYEQLEEPSAEITSTPGDLAEPPNDKPPKDDNPTKDKDKYKDNDKEEE